MSDNSSCQRAAAESMQPAVTCVKPDQEMQLETSPLTIATTLLTSGSESTTTPCRGQADSQLVVGPEWHSCRVSNQSGLSPATRLLRLTSKSSRMTSEGWARRAVEGLLHMREGLPNFFQGRLGRCIGFESDLARSRTDGTKKAASSDIIW